VSAIRQDAGFTLLELLVVIVVIGILALLVIPNLTSAPAKARDAQRKTDLSTLQKAIETYALDNGSYPSTGGSWYGVSANGGSKSLTGAGGYIPNLAPAYIKTLPLDPKPDYSGWSGYLYRSDGTNYKLLAHQNGPESYPTSGEKLYDPVRSTWAWMACSGEPACGSW
jgi:general secretion pathway protein G